MNFSFSADINVEDGVYDMICYDKYDNQVSDPLLLLVGDASIDVEKVTLSIHDKELNVGQEFSITATVSPSNATDKTVTWTVSDPVVVSVDAGVVKALAIGEATVTATTVNGLTATCTVKVKEKVVEVTAITLDVTESTLEVGGALKINATVAPPTLPTKP